MLALTRCWGPTAVSCEGGVAPTIPLVLNLRKGGIKGDWACVWACRGRGLGELSYGWTSCVFVKLRIILSQHKVVKSWEYVMVASIINLVFCWPALSPLYSKGVPSYPGLLATAFVACNINAGEGLVKLSHMIWCTLTCGGVAHSFFTAVKWLSESKKRCQNCLMSSAQSFYGLCL